MWDVKEILSDDSKKFGGWGTKFMVWVRQGSFSAGMGTEEWFWGEKSGVDVKRKLLTLF